MNIIPISKKKKQAGWCCATGRPSLVLGINFRIRNLNPKYPNSNLKYPNPRYSIPILSTTSRNSNLFQVQSSDTRTIRNFHKNPVLAKAHSSFPAHKPKASTHQPSPSIETPTRPDLLATFPVPIPDPIRTRWLVLTKLIAEPGDHKNTNGAMCNRSV